MEKPVESVVEDLNGLNRSQEKYKAKNPFSTRNQGSDFCGLERRGWNSKVSEHWHKASAWFCFFWRGFCSSASPNTSTLTGFPEAAKIYLIA